MLDLTQQKARILLAEDNIINQQATLAVLENMGLAADAVADGQEALNALESVFYDLVLMDCQMPVLDGYEATRMIRNVQSRVRNHQVPVIAMTAHAFEGERDRCLECGMDDFLSKPVLPQALATILEKWLINERTCTDYSTQSVRLDQSRGHQSKEVPVWDRKGMLARLMGDIRVARIICQGFLADLPVQIKTLEAALAEENVTGIIRQAHTIKGAAAIIGGERLQAVAGAMEQFAQTRHFVALQRHLDTLRSEYERLKQQMQQEPPPAEEGK